MVASSRSLRAQKRSVSACPKKLKALRKKQALGEQLSAKRASAATTTGARSGCVCGSYSLPAPPRRGDADRRDATGLHKTQRNPKREMQELPHGSPRRHRSQPQAHAAGLTAPRASAQTDGHGRGPTQIGKALGTAGGGTTRRGETHNASAATEING